MISWQGGLNLLGRNAKSFFLKGYKGIIFGFWSPVVEMNEFDSVLYSLFIGLPLFLSAIVLHTILLPITLPLFSLLQTMVDFFSRKSLPEDEISQFNEKYDAMDDRSKIKLADDLIDCLYDTSSDSSRKLITELYEVNGEFNKAIKAGSENELISLTRKRKFENLEKGKEAHPELPSNSSYALQIVPSDALTPEDLKALGKYQNENRAHCLSQTIAKQATLLKAYVADERNEGKKTQHLIVNSVFSKGLKAPPVIEPVKTHITPLVIS